MTRGTTVVLAGLVMALAAHPGLALAGPLVTPPPGWSADEDHARALAAKASEVAQLGGVRGVATTQVFRPAPPGATLIVTLVAAKVATDREVAARGAVDDLHATSRRAALTGAKVVEDGWQERVDPVARQVEASLAWRDPDAGVATTARLVLAADAETMIAVIGECVARADAAAELIDACQAALATLDPGIPAERRVALSLAPVGTEPPLAEPAAGAPAREPARMDDGSRAPLPPMVIAPEPRRTDRRPVYVGLGIMVIAALFWLNRRRRARFEPEPSGEPDKPEE
jgi:hypothetical protein